MSAKSPERMARPRAETAERLRMQLADARAEVDRLSTLVEAYRLHEFARKEMRIIMAGDAAYSRLEAAREKLRRLGEAVCER